jgi:hypothetical protein
MLCQFAIKSKGFDLAGGIEAYRKAIELDPKEWSNYADLAILLEHDSFGERYSSASRLGSWSALLSYSAFGLGGKSVNIFSMPFSIFFWFFSPFWEI